MLTTVLVMAVAVIFEPVRIGLAVLMLNRPRPVLQLLVFLCGGFTMGLGGGLLVLFTFRAAPFAPGHLTVPKVQIAVGLIALLVAAGIAANLDARNLIHRHPVGAAIGGDAGVLLVQPAPNPRGLARLSTRKCHLPSGPFAMGGGRERIGDRIAVRQLHGCSSCDSRVRGIAGGSGTSLLMFNVVAFTLVEIPLVSSLAAPRRALELMAAFHAWLQSRTRRNIATLVAAMGVFMLVLGVNGLCVDDRPVRPRGDGGGLPGDRGDGGRGRVGRVDTFGFKETSKPGSLFVRGVRIVATPAGIGAEFGLPLGKVPGGSACRPGF